jgi:hypothetical protein
MIQDDFFENGGKKAPQSQIGKMLGFIHRVDGQLLPLPLALLSGLVRQNGSVLCPHVDDADNWKDGELQDRAHCRTERQALHPKLRNERHI